MAITNFPNMFSPFHIGKVEIKNRFCLAPLGFVPAGPDGVYTDAGTNFIVERAKGGFGLLTVGAQWTDKHVDTMDPQAVASPLTNPAGYVKQGYFMNERVHAYGAKTFAMLGTGNGRNNPGQKAPSPVSMFYFPDQMAPEITREEIHSKIEDLKRAAVLAKSANYDGIEIHAMHWGYLLDQFALSIVNQRTDEYGGCLENRLRFAREIREALAEVCGADFPVTMRMGLKSYIHGLGGMRSHMGSLDGKEEAGRTVEEAIEIIKLLESFGYDAISANIGVYESFYYAAPPSYIKDGPVIDLAAQVKKSGVKIPILCGSRMDDPELCEKALVEGKIDAAVIGRPALVEPQLPRKIELGRLDDIRPCLACNQGCIGLGMSKGVASCAVNPAVWRETEYGLTKADTPEKIVVIGGGIAGMETARVAALRGHHVTLFESSGELGGNLIPAGQHEFKAKVLKLNDWYKREMERLGVDIHLNTKADAETVKAENPDAAVVAVGAHPLELRIPGIERTVSCVDALMEHKEVGRNVVVVGGGLVGCELAYEYLLEGKKVTIVEGLTDILSAAGGDPAPIMNEMFLRDVFYQYGTELLTGHKIVGVTEEGAVLASTSDGTETTIPADTVVMAVGFRANPSLTEDLRGNGFPVYEIKHANGIGSVKTAIWAAYEIARGI